MTLSFKHEKILACAATRSGASDSVYFKEAMELKAAGLIRLDYKYTTGGNTVPRWVLVEGVVA